MISSLSGFLARGEDPAVRGCAALPHSRHPALIKTSVLRYLDDAIPTDWFPAYHRGLAKSFNPFFYHV